MIQNNLDYKDAIQLIKKRYGRTYATTYIFKCTNENCEGTFKCQNGKLKTKNHKCASCISKEVRLRVIQKTQLRPHEAQYRRFLRKAKASSKISNLSYEDFLGFVDIKNCHYCDYPIDWNNNTSYNLDRMDDKLPYLKYNCVVCCGLCNFTKRNAFTYDEFLKIGNTIKQIRKDRIK